MIKGLDRGMQLNICAISARTSPFILLHKIETYGKEGDEIVSKLSKYLPGLQLDEWFTENNLWRATKEEIVKLGQEKLRMLKE